MGRLVAVPRRSRIRAMMKWARFRLWRLCMRLRREAAAWRDGWHDPIPPGEW